MRLSKTPSCKTSDGMDVCGAPTAMPTIITSSSTTAPRCTPNARDGEKWEAALGEKKGNITGLAREKVPASPKRGRAFHAFAPMAPEGQEGENKVAQFIQANFAMVIELI